jgi:hypothetical protein
MISDRQSLPVTKTTPDLEVKEEVQQQKLSVTAQKNLKLAEQALAYVKSMGIKTVNHVDSSFSKSNMEKLILARSQASRLALEIESMCLKLADLRQHFSKEFEWPCHDDDLDVNILFILSCVYQWYRVANCGGLTTIAIIWLHRQGVTVEQCTMQNGEHTFGCIGRDSRSDPNDIRTWGSSCVIFDLWSQKVYLAQDFLKQQEDASKINYYSKIALKQRPGLKFFLFGNPTILRTIYAEPSINTLYQESRATILNKILKDAKNRINNRNERITRDGFRIDEYVRQHADTIDLFDSLTKINKCYSDAAIESLLRKKLKANFDDGLAKIKKMQQDDDDVAKMQIEAQELKTQLHSSCLNKDRNGKKLAYIKKIIEAYEDNLELSLSDVIRKMGDPQEQIAAFQQSSDPESKSIFEIEKKRINSCDQAGEVSHMGDSREPVAALAKPADQKEKSMGEMMDKCMFFFGRMDAIPRQSAAQEHKSVSSVPRKKTRLFDQVDVIPQYPADQESENISEMQRKRPRIQDQGAEEAPSSGCAIM